MEGARLRVLLLLALCIDFIGSYDFHLPLCGNILSYQVYYICVLCVLTLIFLFPAYSQCLFLCRQDVAVFPAIVARVRQSINSGPVDFPLPPTLLLECADLSNVTYEW